MRGEARRRRPRDRAPRRGRRSGAGRRRRAAPPAKTDKPRAAIADVRFKEQNGAARIEIAGRAPWRVERPDAKTLVLTLEGAALPKKLERSLDTGAFAGPVAMVSSFNQPSTGSVKIVASLRGEAHDEVVETAGGLAWTVAPGLAAKHEATQPVALAGGTPRVQSSEGAAAGFTAEAPSYAASGAPQRREYTGRRITLDFHDIEIRNLLRLIADVSKKNIVVADDVGGKVDRLAAQRPLGPGARPRPPDEGARQGGDGERHPRREGRGDREGAGGPREGRRRPASRSSRSRSASSR